ncbi:MAG: hypothetical protein AAGA60_11760 [Cyanobacteria bacterium P01_E01_bin.42]
MLEHCLRNSSDRYYLALPSRLMLLKALHRLLDATFPFMKAMRR